MPTGDSVRQSFILVCPSSRMFVPSMRSMATPLGMAKIFPVGFAFPSSPPPPLGYMGLMKHRKVTPYCSDLCSDQHCPAKRLQMIIHDHTLVAHTYFITYLNTVLHFFETARSLQFQLSVQHITYYCNLHTKQCLLNEEILQ